MKKSACSGSRGGWPMQAVSYREKQPRGRSGWIRCGGEWYSCVVAASVTSIHLRCLKVRMVGLVGAGGGVYLLSAGREVGGRLVGGEVGNINSTPSRSSVAKQQRKLSRNSDPVSGSSHHHCFFSLPAPRSSHVHVPSIRSPRANLHILSRHRQPPVCFSAAQLPSIQCD